ncbi:Hypothetical_protein [Hexamita inflata]|uniref:Hypothetical_protein n=1 Tax=Hexamita inflata TaxID=28002 RepID=A0AA86U4M6_9EUKA|nr:Hypothetical protein HINF_LOCUS18198 [Hexamita inflata]
MSYNQLIVDKIIELLFESEKVLTQMNFADIANKITLFSSKQCSKERILSYYIKMHANNDDKVSNALQQYPQQQCSPDMFVNKVQRDLQIIALEFDPQLPENSNITQVASIIQSRVNYFKSKIGTNQNKEFEFIQIIYKQLSRLIDFRCNELEMQNYVYTENTKQQAKIKTDQIEFDTIKKNGEQTKIHDLPNNIVSTRKTESKTQEAKIDPIITQYFTEFKPELVTFGQETTNQNEQFDSKQVVQTTQSEKPVQKIELKTIKTFRSSYSVEFQQRLLKAYENGYTYEQMTKICNKYQTGTTEKTINMIIDKYNIQRKRDKMKLPVRLEFLNGVKDDEYLSGDVAKVE